VMCGDHVFEDNLDAVTRLASELNLDAFITGPQWIYRTLPCLDWPRAVDPIGEIGEANTPPILVIGGVDDPQTPLEWSVAMADALDNAVLIVSEHRNHAVTFRGVSECVDSYVLDYLFSLRVPNDNTRCPVGP
jgi:pimeloyl-ACP methyl ester carboxylesterase